MLRYRTLVNSYGEVGDASVFDTYGRRFANFWLHNANAVRPQLDNIRQSNFLRWFTGVVYYLFGSDMIAGFIVFGLDRVRRLLPLVPRDRRSRSVPRPAPLLPDRHVRAEHPVLAVVDRQGSVDAVRDRQRRAGDRAHLQRQARARCSRRGPGRVVDVGRSTPPARSGRAGGGRGVRDRAEPAQGARRPRRRRWSNRSASWSSCSSPCSR